MHPLCVQVHFPEQQRGRHRLPVLCRLHGAQRRCLLRVPSWHLQGGVGERPVLERVSGQHELAGRK